MSWICPSCNTENPDSFTKCSCGYEVPYEERASTFSPYSSTKNVESMKYFSEDEKYINAECGICKRVVKILKEDCIQTEGGYKVTTKLRCLCGRIFETIQGTAESTHSYTSVTSTNLSSNKSQFLKPCRNCGHKISLDADNCPSCGGQSPALSQKSMQWIYIIAFGLAILFTIWLLRTCRSVGDEFKSLSIESEKAVQELEKSQKELEELRKKYNY